MAKSYTDDLAAWVQKRATKKRRQDAAAVAFLAVKQDVSAALEAGYALTTIWEHMHETGKVKCSYETFRKHAKRYIRKPPATDATPPATATQGDPPGRSSTSTAPKKPEPPTMGGFSYSPTPNKEDLI